jgi:broad specificity phosphatase PhoE
MKLYIVRHGETDANTQGIVQGWLDTELNDKGVSQAIEAARNFSKPIDAIYASDLKRATRTAQEFRNHHKDIPYFEDERLRERNFGDATGTHRIEHDWEQFWAIEDRATIPNAEIINDFTARVANFLDELKTKQYNAVLIVGHSGTLNRVQPLVDVLGTIDGWG